jgi:hypothetical protein
MQEVTGALYPINPGFSKQTNHINPHVQRYIRLYPNYYQHPPKKPNLVNSLSYL